MSRKGEVFWEIRKDVKKKYFKYSILGGWINV